MKNCDSEIEKAIQTAWEADYEKVPENQIHTGWTAFERKINRPRSRFSKIYAAAAVLTILIVSTFFLTSLESPVRIANTSMVDKEVILPDGSRIILKPEAGIEYSQNFNPRDIALKGNAFFDVVKDSSKTFQITTENTTTRVLGTSFLIEEEKNEHKDTRITLYSGRVLVSVNGNTEAWALIPGESFVYQNRKAAIETFETILSFEAGNKFIDINYLELNKVLEFLRQRFGYDFEVANEIADKRVTLRINKTDNLEQILKVLSIINQTTYEMNPEQKNFKIIKK